MSALEITGAAVAETVERLRASNTRERVVLWLGRRQDDIVHIHEVFLPMQETAADDLPDPARRHGGAVGSHAAETTDGRSAGSHAPRGSLYSPADDCWAIVRHQGALSLVVPRFCQTTSAATFVQDALVSPVDKSDRFVYVHATAATR